jgi:hypothetical protein
MVKTIGRVHHEIFNNFRKSDQEENCDDISAHNNASADVYLNGATVQNTPTPIHQHEEEEQQKKTHTHTQHTSHTHAHTTHTQHTHTHNTHTHTEADRWAHPRAQTAVVAP